MIEAATPEGVAANALLESVQRAIRGEEVSDFMLSFPIVREAKDAHGRIAELDEWLSRSYPLRCRDCGVPYEQFGLDTVLPDEQWARLFPSGVEGQGGGGVLCASCIVKRASKLPGTVVLKAHIEGLSPEDGSTP